MANSQIRFCSFQDADFVFESLDTQPEKREEAEDFVELFVTLKGIHQVGSHSLGEYVLNQQALKRKPPEDSNNTIKECDLNTSFLSDFLQPQKLVRFAGNKL